MVTTFSKPIVKPYRDMTIVNYTNNHVFKEIWSHLDDNLRAWLPDTLNNKSGHSQITFHSPDKWLCEVFWLKENQVMPSYYWIEKKDGEIKLNYLPKQIKKMLKDFQNEFGKPSTRGVVFSYTPQKSLTFCDLVWKENKWELYPDKILEYRFQKVYKKYLYDGKMFKVC